MQRPFMMVFTNKLEGKPFSHFEIELMQAFVDANGILFYEPAQPDDEDSDQATGNPMYTVFGKFRQDLCEKKGVRQEIAAFDTFEEAADLLDNIGVIDEEENS